MPSLAKGRNIVNWKKADWAPYPGKGASAYSWAPIRPASTGWRPPAATWRLRRC